MSDMGEVFKAWNESKKSKRHSNRKSSTQMLIDAGIEFTSHNCGIHLQIKRGPVTIDYWPSTGKWMTKGFRYGVTNRGIRSLLDFIKNELTP